MRKVTQGLTIVVERSGTDAHRTLPRRYLSSSGGVHNQRELVDSESDGSTETLPVLTPTR